MKNLKILALNILTSVAVYAQTYTPFSYSPKFNGSGIFTGSLSVGQNSGPNPSAAFEVYSTNKGFLMPRLSTLQRNSINYPSIGLQIYNTTTSAINYYNGSSWIAVGTGAGTVTSVAATVPSVFSVSGSPITTSGTLAITYSGTPLPVVNGGIGLNSYTVGDLIYASGVTTLSKLADVATGNALISGGVGTAPSWGKVSESHLSFSDVTTVNVSNSAHGLFPKLTANSIYYINNSGELTALTVGASGTVLTGNGVTSAPTWTAVSSGITVGTTTITSGTTLRIPYNLAGVYQEQANFTIGSVASGVLDVPVGYASRGVKFANQYDTGLQLTIGYLSGLGATMVSNTFNANYAYNTLVGIGAGNAISGAYAGGNTALGYEALKATGGAGNPEVYSNTAIGFRALGTWAGGTGYNVALGYRAGYGTGSTLRYATFLGFLAGDGSAFNSVIAIGANSTPTAANQCIIGATGAASGNGVIDNVYFNGVTHTSAAPVVINACGGSGTNNAGANLTLAGGRPTGNSTSGGYVSISGTPTVGVSGTGAQALAEIARFTKTGDLTLGINSDTKGLVLKSPDGHYWRITVTNLGALTVTDTGTSIPN